MRIAAYLQEVHAEFETRKSGKEAIRYPNRIGVCGCHCIKKSSRREKQERQYVRTAINFVVLESVPELFVLRRVNVNVGAVSVAELSRSLLPKSLHVLEWSRPLFLVFPVEHASHDDF